MSAMFRFINVQRPGLRAGEIMSKQNNGARAFPVDSVVERDEKGHLHGFEISSGGMTLRDYFAAKAMQGEISKSEGFEKPENVAKFAYEVADAMLLAREAS